MSRKFSKRLANYQISMSEKFNKYSRRKCLVFQREIVKINSAKLGIAEDMNFDNDLGGFLMYVSKEREIFYGSQGIYFIYISFSFDSIIVNFQLLRSVTANLLHYQLT